MRIFAWFWHVVDLDPTHMVNLTLPDDTMVPTTIGDVPSYPEVARAWTKFVRCIVVALGGCALLTTPLTTWFVKLSQKIGVDILKERQERGATLVSAEMLAAEIAAYNMVLLCVAWRSAHSSHTRGKAGDRPGHDCQGSTRTRTIEQ
jgi:hypothetical protein